VAFLDAPVEPAAVVRHGEAREAVLELHAHLGVLRAAMATDRHDTPGLYFGTSTGQLFASADEGDSWNEIADHLPPIWSVEVATVE
jgi:hypothetical protein